MSIRICTYNCKNYFSAENAGYSKPAREKKALAKTINSVAADILCLQEVENESVLEEINESINEPYEYYLLEQGNCNRGINLGMMSRMIFEGQSHKNLALKDANGVALYEYRDQQGNLENRLSPALYQRDLYLCEFNIGASSLLVFNAHFKSRKNYRWLNHDADTIRLAEASMTREIVSQYTGDPNNLVLLAGDLNQRHNHKSLRPVTQWGELYDPVLDEVLSRDPASTTFHPKPRERIDYLLPGSNLAGHYIPGSAKIHRNATARTASDHLPVSIDLEF